MISGLHHIAVVARDLAAATRDYALLLERQPDWTGRSGDADIASFHLANLNLMLCAPATRESATGAAAHLEQQGEGLWTLSFAVSDAAKAHRLLSRRALGAEAPQPVTESGDTLVVALPPAATHGIGITLVQSPPGPRPPGAAALDHVVVGTPDPERALVLYGARLGLDLRLDRSNPDWDARLLFFRCGDLIVEIAHRLSGGRSEGPDRLMGLSWRAADIARTHARLADEGFAVSELRKGRRPGTRVFTVRNKTCGVPTIFIGSEAR